MPLMVAVSLILVAMALTACPPGATAAPLESGPYAAWARGPSADPGFFPLAVWLQDPDRAEEYRALGINAYVGLWKGPTEEQLARLRKAGMKVICDQNDVGLKHLDDPTIIGWMHGDEPDNAQPRSEGGYGPGIPPANIIADYQEMRRRDPTRPVILNLGQGVAYDDWKGIGCTLDEYPEYIKGCDIVSFDIYPMANQVGLSDGANWLWLVARGLERLGRWGEGQKVVWNALECTQISEPGHKATPDQVRSEVWMSIIHGSRGIIYFVHQFRPTFIEAALLADPEMSPGVKAINQQVLSFAPLLNSPSVENAVGVASSNPDVPVDIMVKRQGDSIYIFAIGMRNHDTRAAFRVEDLRRNWVKRNGTAQVMGEGRTLPIWGGKFEDEFRPYQVHIYKVDVAEQEP